MTAFTSDELRAIVDELSTLIKSDDTVDPAARALGVLAVTLVGTMILDVHRAADALETIAAKYASVDDEGAV